MNTYKALIKLNDATGDVDVIELENTFSLPAFSWVNDGAGRCSVKRTGALPESLTFCRGTNLYLDNSTVGNMFVAVERTSDDYIEVSVSDRNGDQVSPSGYFPVEFSVY